MKKLLALVLALVMTLGLATVGANAAIADAESIDHEEAVEVLSSLGVIGGKENNNFDPDGLVKRSEMAKMIAIILLGADVNDSAFVGASSTLTDINGHWAEGYIKYCVSQKVVGGYGDGTFKPDKDVTTAEAAKMLLTALGYNAQVQEYTGTDWSINVLRDASTKKLFKDLTGMAANKAITRDEAAQMIWNTVQRGMIIKEAGQDRDSTGLITDRYTDTDLRGVLAGGPLTLLDQTFNAQIWLGTYSGNYYTDSTGVTKDAIRLSNAADESTYTNGNVGRTVYVKSDLGLENIGEQVKVIFKDSTNAGGSAGVPDTTDTVYGVYNTKALQVINTVRAKIDGPADQTQLANGKVKIDGVFYDVTNYGTVGARAIAYSDSLMLGTDTTIENGGSTLVTGGTVAANVVNIGTPVANGNGTLTAAELARFFSYLADDESDSVKFIFNPDGEVAKVAIVNYTLNKVTSATSTAVAVQGIGAQKYEDGLVAYDGIAKDDVVVYHAVGAVGAGTNGYYVIEKAESVEGEITGYAVSSVTGANANKLDVDGTRYTIFNGDNATLATTITDDAMTSTVAALTNEIGTTVKAYLVNGMVGAIQRISKTTYNYALVLADNNDPTAGLDTGKVMLLLADGTKQTYSVYKDSTYQANAARIETGTLIKYNVRSDGTIEIKAYADADNNTSAGAGATMYTSTSFAGTNFYTKATKVVTDGAGHSGVATNDCVLFVRTTTLGNVEDQYKAYSIRTLSNVAGVGYDIAFYMNADGQVIAAYIDNSTTGDVSSGSTNYGFVTASNGVVKLGDDEYHSYSVWNGSETITIYTNKANLVTLAKNNYIAYGTVTDNKYDSAANLEVLTVTNGNCSDVATKKWDEGDKTLTYFTSVTLNGTVYEGDAAITDAMASNVKVIYVDRDKSVGVEDFGVTGFDSSTGYSNAKIVFNTEGEVAVLFVETSGEKNINGATGVAGVAGTAYTGATFVTAMDATTTTTLTGTGAGTYYKMPATSAVVDSTVTLDQSLYVAAGQTLNITGDLVLGTGHDVVVEGQLVVAGDVTSATGVLYNRGGTITVTAGAASGDVANLTQTNGTTTIAGTLAELTDANKGTVTAATITSVEDTSVDTGDTLNIYGAVGDVKDVTNTGTGNTIYHGAVTKVTDINSGTVTFNGDVGVETGAAANGILQITNATAVNINAKAFITTAATLTAGTVKINSTGSLYVGVKDSGAGVSVNLSGLTINGENGAKLILVYTSNGTKNHVTTANGQLYNAAGNSIDTTYDAGVDVTTPSKIYTHNGTHFCAPA